MTLPAGTRADRLVKTQKNGLPQTADVAEAWMGWGGQIHTFARRLDQEGTAYLSFSKVSSLEFCPQRYLLEYVQGKRLRPEPTYFKKGRLIPSCNKP